MVDFQSRDTRRGIDDGDDADEAKSSGGSETVEASDSDTAEADSATTETDEMADESTPEGMTYAVVSVSAERTVEQDPPGDAVVTAIEESGATVITRDIIRPTYDAVQSTVGTLVGRRDVRAVVTTGGTGVEPDDVTVQAVEPLLDKGLPGFGELFRLRCHERSGSAVIRTRATAGIADGAPVFCLPGDARAASLGAAEIIVPEAEALADLAAGGEA